MAVNLNGLLRNSLYIALSRCTTLSGLYLLGVTTKRPFDKNKIESERLPNIGFKSACPFLANFKDHTTILYSNVQSLRKFLSKDVWNYIMFNCPTFFIAAETWTEKEDEINISNYQILARIDSSH